MLNKLYFGLAAVAVVMAGIFMFGGSAKFSAQTVNYSTSGGSQNLYNNQASLLTDITAVRAALVGSVKATTALDFPSIVGGSSTATSTQVTGLSAALNDLVLVQPNFVTAETSTSFFATVLTASTSNATIGIIEQNGSGASFDATNSTYSVMVLPFASFGQPAALNTVTSTSN